MAADSRPLVVLAGPINPDGRALLEKEARVVVCEDETEAGLAKAAAEAQGILFRIRPNCSASLMAACKQLRVVGRHGVGLDTVDIPAATRLGVAVVHAPGSNSQAVAEHALMLMLASVKRTLLIDKMTRGGDWGAKRNAGASEGNTELAGKTLGIVGVGNIGRRVAKFAGAIGMRVLGYDKYVPEDEVRRRGALLPVVVGLALPATAFQASIAFPASQGPYNWFHLLWRAAEVRAPSASAAVATAGPAAATRRGSRAPRAADPAARTASLPPPAPPSGGSPHG